LPAEIRNEKDPAKIAAYYQQREARLRQELTQNAPPPTPRQAVTIEQPTDDARRPVTMSLAEAQAARTTLILAARTQAQLGKKYWGRLEVDILKIMEQQPPENQVDTNVWSTAYNSLVGANLDRLLQEDRDAQAAADQARITSERSAAVPGAVATPPPLPVEVTSKVLPGLNITEAQYRTAQDNIAAGIWPLTADNTNGKRLRIGGGER
jgi:hypothetical protein